MARVFIDTAGLTTVGVSALRPYLLALGLVGEPVLDRLSLLARLREGAGCVILTGPEGAPFWSLVSKEVKVRVAPDDEEYGFRTDTVDEWALRAVGCNSATVTTLLKRKTPPPVSHKYHEQWVAAQSLLARLDAVGPAAPIIEEDFHAEQWTVDEGEQLLGTDMLLAVDGEWDIETAVPTGVSLGTPEVAGYVPLWASDYQPAGNNPQRPNLSSDGDGPRLKQAVARRLLSGKPTIMHGGRADLNALFDGEPLDLHGKADLDDTMVMAYLCGEPVLALKELARTHLSLDPVDFPGNLSELPVGLGTRYAAADARNTYDLYARLARTLVEREQWGVYSQIEKPLVPLIASMEREGVPLDLEECKRLYRDTVAVEQGVRRAIRDNYGFDVANDNGKTLDTNEARQFVAWARGGRDPGTLDQRVLTMFPEGEIDLLLLHRRSRTLRRNFLGRALRYYYAATHPGHDAHLFKARKRFTEKGELTDLGQYLEWRRQWSALGTPDTFRYFPRFNQAGSMDGENRRAPRSGRLSSSGPNFQQQSRLIRSIYVPPPGCVWWSWDYSGLELHIAAALSQDKEMLRVLTEVCPDGKCTHKPKHGDLHGYLQKIVQDMTGHEYERAVVVKPFNFMELYGGSPAKGVEIVAKSRTYISLETAQHIDAGHHAAFPGYWRWAEGRHEFHARYGYGETLFGRRRYEPDIFSRDSERRSYALRALLNHEIQGTGADIVKMAMNLTVPILRKYGAHMAAQVHDELDGWISETADLAGFRAEMEEALTSIILPGGLRLKVEGGFGKNWGEAH